MPQQSTIDEQLPVFAFPQSLTFYMDDPSSHKQIVTVYNPYNFHVKFRVLSTDARKYSVSDSQGFIRSNHGVDIVFHHKALFPSNVGITDKIRLQLFHERYSHCIGMKDVTVTLLPTKPEGTTASAAADSDSFQQLSTESTPIKQLKQLPMAGSPERNNPSYSLSVIVLFIALAIILIPNEGYYMEYVPSFLRPGQNHKLVAAFFLGLSVMVVFRT